MIAAVINFMSMSVESCGWRRSAPRYGLQTEISQAQGPTSLFSICTLSGRCETEFKLKS